MFHNITAVLGLYLIIQGSTQLGMAEDDGLAIVGTLNLIAGLVAAGLVIWG